jgi:hypothetical protein
MPDLERPERITNITGLRAQAEPPDAPPPPADARPVRWPSTPCRLCGRQVWVFARACVCGMPDPGRSARTPYLVRGAAAVAVLAGLGWWVVGR